MDSEQVIVIFTEVCPYNFWRYCTFVPPLLLLMSHHEKMWLKALP